MTDLPMLPATPYVLTREARPYEPEYTLSESGYSDDDMHAYGRACIEADRAQRAEPAELSDEQIGRIAENCAKAMPDGISGFCKTWGWRQFARELLDVCAGHVRAAPPSDAAGASRALLSGARPVSLSLLRQALEALEHHREQTRPISWTDETIAALRAELQGAADAAGAKAQWDT